MHELVQTLADHLGLLETQQLDDTAPGREASSQVQCQQQFGRFRLVNLERSLIKPIQELAKRPLRNYLRRLDVVELEVEVCPEHEGVAGQLDLGGGGR